MKTGVAVSATPVFQGCVATLTGPNVTGFSKMI
jgi:hypothetical protein